MILQGSDDRRKKRTRDAYARRMVTLT